MICRDCAMPAHACDCKCPYESRDYYKSECAKANVAFAELQRQIEKLHKDNAALLIQNEQAQDTITRQVNQELVVRNQVNLLQEEISWLKRRLIEERSWMG